MSSDQLQEARRYGRQQLACHLAQLVLELLTLGLLAFVFARPLESALLELGLYARWLRLGALFLVLTVVGWLVGFPLSWYSGYYLEHRFQLSRQNFPRWLGRNLMQLGLTTLLGLALVEGLFAIIATVGAWWWLVAAAGMFAVTALLGQLAPVLILPLFYRVRRLEDAQLLARFRQLAAGTGLRIEGVYRMELSRETAKANAMLAGLGRTRRVILGDTLLDGFAPEEIEVVLAHEIGHHVYHHLPKLLATSLLYSAAVFLLCDWAVRSALAAAGDPWEYAALPIWTLPLILWVAMVASTLLAPLQNAVSRYFERQCDRYALDRTGLPGAYCSAFRKLAQLNKADPDPPWLEVVLLHDHPPIAQRLRMAETQ